MLEALFGETPLALRFFIAFMVVLGLMGTCAWLIQRFKGTGLTAMASRGRQPRLAVIDSASVDGRRRLILVRRDNVEHLLMIGGPTDVLVEPNIVRAGATRELPPARAAANGSDTLPRPLPLGEGSTWPLQPQPQSEPALRPARPPVANQEPRWTEPEPKPEPAARAPRSVDTLAGLAEELSARPEPSDASYAEAPHAEPRLEAVRSEPARTPPVVPADQPSINAAADQNLAEMAQRLEAALRRPAPEAARGVAAGPRAAADAGPPTRGRSVQTPAANAPEARGRPAGKSLYDSLEQEMASLLGRPAGKS
ncbi:MAG: flagellar biosynthesis protein FliO [Xanthobacteraceae bacterium]